MDRLREGRDRAVEHAASGARPDAQTTLDLVFTPCLFSIDEGQSPLLVSRLWANQISLLYLFVSVVFVYFLLVLPKQKNKIKKVVVFDSSIPVQLAFYALVEHGENSNSLTLFSFLKKEAFLF